jgi:CRISPR-associated protein Cas2
MANEANSQTPPHSPAIGNCPSGLGPRLLANDHRLFAQRAMSRLRYLVSYDISDPKRLRKVARSLEGFGVRLQYSVFECPLDDLRLAKLKAELQDLLDHEEDQVLFVSLGPSANDASLIIEAMGLPYEVRSRVTII